MDGNHVLRLISRLKVDGLRPIIAPIALCRFAVADLDLDNLAFLFRQVRIHFPHRCNIPFRIGFLDNLQSNGVLHFQLDNGAFVKQPVGRYNYL